MHRERQRSNARTDATNARIRVAWIQTRQNSHTPLTSLTNPQTQLNNFGELIFSGNQNRVLRIRSMEGKPGRKKCVITRYHWSPSLGS